MRLINLVTFFVVGVLTPFSGWAESEVVDHSMWGSLLTEYVDGDGRVVTGVYRHARREAHWRVITIAHHVMRIDTWSKSADFSPHGIA